MKHSFALRDLDGQPVGGRPRLVPAVGSPASVESGTRHRAPGKIRDPDAMSEFEDCTVNDDAPRAETTDHPQKTLVTGVIGVDTHIVGNRILGLGLEAAGYEVIALGALTPAEEFIKAAVETAADGIMVSSLYGQGELDCRGFRDLCIEAGLTDILLYVGGNLVVGKQPWPEVEKRFLDMGFDRAFAPGARMPEILDALQRDFAAREQGLRRAED